MSITSTAQTLPRLLVQGYLHAARVPLNAVARVARQQDNEQWPPTLAFESFEAGVETVIGSVLRDPTLVENGQVRQAKVAELRKATQLSTVADKERVAADKAAEGRRKEIAAQRKAAERQATERKKEIERQAQANQQKTETAAVKKEAAARQAKAAQDKAIDRQERVATTSALSAESRALDIAKEALEAEEKVALIDASLEGTHEARKSS